MPIFVARIISLLRAPRIGRVFRTEFCTKTRISGHHRNTTCRFENSNIQRAGRVRAHGEAAKRGRTGANVDRTVRPGKKGGRFFEKGVLRRRGGPSKNLFSSFFEAEDRRPLIFDLQSRRSKNPPSGTLDLRSPRSKNPPSSIFGPKNGPKIGRKKRGGGTSSSEERRTPHLRPSPHEERRTPYLTPSRPEEWTKNPLVLIIPTPSLLGASSSQLSWGLDLQTDLSPWKSIRRSRSGV